MTREDKDHINAAYAALHDALNEVCMVRDKDRVLIHMQNVLYALEDTLYEYIGTEDKK